VLLASVSLLMALQAATSAAAAAKSVTIRVLLTPVTRKIEDVSPKDAQGRGEWSKGDTHSGNVDPAKCRGPVRSRRGSLSCDHASRAGRGDRVPRIVIGVIADPVNQAVGAR
jgi:hypothetical protein